MVVVTALSMQRRVRLLRWLFSVPAMLALDRAVATERQLPINVVRNFDGDLSMFRAGEFDLVVQPVSTCYVQKSKIVYSQIAPSYTS